MNAIQRGLLLAVIQVALVSSLGAKLLIDRATRPRVWVRAEPYDPSSPFRGRYVRLKLIPSDVMSGGDHPTSGETPSIPQGIDSTEAVVFFIPEKVPDPSIRPPGEQLWVEVTVPKEGPPRPIRLGVRKDGELTPLPLR
jgi:hypothetical protein